MIRGNLVMVEKPQIFNAKEEASEGVIVVDAFESSLEELFFVENPRYKKSMAEAKEPLAKFLKENGIKEVWIYYSWRNKMIRCLPENLYFKLRTARNRDIITAKEQENYRATKVGVVGLSVGSAILRALVMSGGPKVLKIADFDIVEVSNLNRINANLLDVGENKTLVAARDVWELDPFADLRLWENGVTKDNLKDFIGGDPRLDIFIDEMDSLDLKILSRIICKELKIPVLMATDNGDSVVLDIERFDLENDRPIFHGLAGDIKPDDLQNLNYKEWLKLATKIIGPEYLPESIQRSLLEIGKTISSVPQLGPTASVAGAAMAFVMRKIANGQEMPSGRYVINLEEKLIVGYNDPENKEERERKRHEFINRFA